MSLEELKKELIEKYTNEITEIQIILKKKIVTTEEKEKYAKKLAILKNKIIEINSLNYSNILEKSKKLESNYNDFGFLINLDEFGINKFQTLLDKYNHHKFFEFKVDINIPENISKKFYNKIELNETVNIDVLNNILFNLEGLKNKNDSIKMELDKLINPKDIFKIDLIDRTVNNNSMIEYKELDMLRNINEKLVDNIQKEIIEYYKLDDKKIITEKLNHKVMYKKIEIIEQQKVLLNELKDKLVEINKFRDKDDNILTIYYNILDKYNKTNEEYKKEIIQIKNKIKILNIINKQINFDIKDIDINSDITLDKLHIIKNKSIEEIKYDIELYEEIEKYINKNGLEQLKRR